METGRARFKVRDLTDLLQMYGVGDPQRQELLDLAEQANAAGWWQQYDDVLAGWFENYIGLEQATSIIRTYQPQFVPGLLQTASYARAVVELGYPDDTAARNDRRVALRLARQELLEGASGPKVWAAVDEAALRRPIGGAAVRTQQLRHLLEITDRPNVTLQLVPFDLGGHAAAGGPFTILRFPGPDLPDVVYLEQLTSALYLDRRADTDHYMAVMDRLCAAADSPEQTRRFLERLLAQS